MPGAQLTISKVKWVDIWPAGEALFKEHRAEIIVENPKIPYEMDWDLARRYCELDIMQCVAAHEDGVLIGYCIFFVSPSIESRGKLVGTQGPWFVTAAQRHSSVAVKMWKLAMESLRSRGVTYVLAHRYERSNPRLDDFFLRQGAERFAHVFSLVLGE